MDVDVECLCGCVGLERLSEFNFYLRWWPAASLLCFGSPHHHADSSLTLNSANLADSP